MTDFYDWHKSHLIALLQLIEHYNPEVVKENIERYDEVMSGN